MIIECACYVIPIPLLFLPRIFSSPRNAVMINLFSINVGIFYVPETTNGLRSETDKRGEPRSRAHRWVILYGKVEKVCHIIEELK